MKYKKWCKKMFELNSLSKAIAIDESGIVYVYTGVPGIQIISWKSSLPSTLIGKSTWEIDWKESLVIRDEVYPLKVRALKRWKPKVGCYYFLPYPTNDSLHVVTEWHGDTNDKFRYNRNLVFKTKKEAVCCAKKMLEALK